MSPNAVQTRIIVFASLLNCAELTRVHRWERDAEKTEGGIFYHALHDLRPSQ